MNSNLGSVKYKSHFLNSSFSYGAPIFIRRQFIWHEHVGEDYKLNRINLFVKKRQIVYFDDVKRFCRKETDARVSFIFLQRTEKSARVSLLSQNATEHAVLLYPRVCRGFFELTNKTDMMNIKLLRLLKSAVWSNSIKHLANAQTSCGFRTHSQLILVLARAARLVGKRFR
jgi:hypothetical protein